MAEIVLDYLIELLKPDSWIADTMEKCQSLQRTLASIKLVTVDISKHHLDSRYVETTLKEIRGVVGEAEDAMNYFLVLASVHKSKIWMSRPLYPKGFWDVRKQIANSAHKAKEIHDEGVILTLLKTLSYQGMSITSDTLGKPTHQIGSEIETLEIIENDAALINHMRDNWMQAPVAALVGHEDTIRAVIDLLCSDSNYLEIVPIVGIEGIGKTTLAKRVLNDPLIRAEFPIRVFIHVSKEYDFREILIAILSSCSTVSSKTIMQSEEELATAVREQLKLHKYLIIMDDVRGREDWDKLKAALCNNKNGSRVLITSRNKFVAAYANPCTQPHVLRQLTDGESRDLFRLMFFGDSNGNPMELEPLVVSVVKMCAGMPFATILAAAYLQVSERRDFYFAVEHLNSYVPRDVLVQPRSLISMVYEEMDESMKPCFLYLGIFPKGYQIAVPKLLRLWIAEGFDEGEKTLKKLLSLNMVVVGKRSLDGEVKTCQLYEMVAEFCKQKGMEEDLFHDIFKGKRTRRICISSSELDNHLSTIIPFGENNLHSFLTTKKKEAMLSEKHMSLICKSKYLRVLDVATLTLPRFPAQVFQLLLLKYIAIRGSIRTVPSQVSSMLNLETLDVETTYKALEIRAKLWKMHCFRHLLTNAATVLRIPDKEEILPNENTQTPESFIADALRLLIAYNVFDRKEFSPNEKTETLSTISPESCRQDVFYCTPKLRKLGIRGDLALLNFSILCELKYLEKLKLLSVSTRFPLQTPVFPPTIRNLTLMNTQLSWSQMSILGKMECLTVLKLKDNACVGDAWTTNHQEFKRLEVLHMGKTNLSIWDVASADHFPMLKCLLLKFCDALQGIPESLADIPALREIKIQGATPPVAASANKIQELKLQSGNGILELSIA